MNIQSTKGSRVAARPLAQQQTPPTQPPVQSDPVQPKDSFDVNFSRTLETTIPIYSAAVGGSLGATGGVLGGALVGAIMGGAGGSFLGGAVGFLGGGFLGIKGGHSFGKWAMRKSGEVGARHTPDEPAHGKAVGQAIAGGAITLLTGSPLMTAVVIGGSAAYAAHKSAAGG